VNLLSNLPSFDNNHIVESIQHAYGIEADILNKEIDDAINQFFIDRATWGLDLWERMYRIKQNNLDIQTRRENIKAKRRIKGTTSKKAIKNICEAYSNGEVEVVMHNDELAFEIKFIGSIGIPAGFEEMDKTIEKIKPCHLGHSYKFNYNTHADLSKFTHEQLANYTHDEIRISENLRGDEDIPAPSYGNIVVSTNVINIEEGNSTSFTVCLDKAPIDNQIVSIGKNNNDVILDKTSLTFTSSNYNIPQTVNINVLEDNDFLDETCVITLSSKNVLSKTIVVNIIDNDSEPVNIPVQSISLNKNTLSLKPNESEKLIATIYPFDATNKNMTWKSSNVSVAGVNYDGMISAYNKGNAIITVTAEDGNKTATCDVTVSNSNSEENIPPSSGNGIILNNTSFTINETEMLTLSATINIDNSYAVFELRQNGTYLVSAYRSGSNIVCYTGGLNAGTYSNLTAVAKTMKNSVYVDIAESQPFTLTVNSNSSSDGGGTTTSGIKVEPASISIEIGKTADITMLFGNDVINKNLDFMSSNGAIASVSDLGSYKYRITGVGQGNTTIRFRTSDGKFETSCSVTVTGGSSGGGGSTGGDTSTSSEYAKSCTSEYILDKMYPMGQRHEAIPSGLITDTWKHNSRWENQYRPTAVAHGCGVSNCPGTGPFKALGCWSNVYRVEGTPFTQNTGVEMKDIKVYGWYNGAWELVQHLPVPNGNFYPESFGGDVNKYFADSVRQTSKSKTIILREKNKIDAMNWNTNQLQTENCMYHPFSNIKNFDTKYEYIYTCIDLRKVKWDENGIDDRDSTHYCSNCGGDWWLAEGLMFHDSWQHNKGVCQPKMIEITNEWRRFSMTTVPQGWSNGFPK
jgi:uncharacterized protein YjdB